MKFNSVLTALLLSVALLVTACNNGSGGGGSNVFGLNGGPVSGTFSATSTSAQIYTFNVVTDTAYTISAVTTAGDIMLLVYNGSPLNNNIIGYSWNSLATTPYNNVSFIASFTGSVSIVVGPMTSGNTSYTLQAFDGNLPFDSTKTASTYNSSINYSFDAVSGTAYQVRLTPQTGNADIGSVNAKLTASVGSSALIGTSMDTVTFLAPATQRYYIKASPTSANTTFNIQVATTTSDPDLNVVVDSAVSDSANVTVNYTVHNQGINSAGAFNVTGWSDSASAPTVGATGGQNSPAYASLAGGASVSGTLVIVNSAASGTAYVIVDNANAVVETTETNNVSAGKAWQQPLIGAQSFNFENNVIPTSMTMSGNAVWAVDATTGSVSTHSLKAGTILDSQTSCTAMSVANGVSISFDYAVESESYGDYLNFYIDGVLKSTWSGAVLWASTSAFPVTSAVHEYKWCYNKDSSVTTGRDTAWIDNIVVTAAPPPTVDLQVVINSAVSNGSSVTISYTVSNAGNSASGPFNVDLMSNNAGVPALGTIGQSTVPTASLAAGASVTGSVTVANATTAGTAYAIVDTTNQINETNEANNISTGYSWSASVDLQVVVTSAVSDQTNVTVCYTASNPTAYAASAFNIDLWSNSASVPTIGSTGQMTVTIAAGLAAGATVSGCALPIANAGASGTAYAIVDTTNLVAEGIETNNISAGKPWIKPSSVPLTYNFNDSVVPSTMVMSSNPSGLAAWVPNTVTTGKGGNAVSVLSLKAGTITNSQSTCVAVSAAGSSSVKFDYSVSSEASYDFLQFFIDGVQQGAGWSGTVAWTVGTTMTTSIGLHEFKWCYTKDSSTASGSDTAWIDNIVIN